jgi:16S rRNA (cytosine1402-N4)-methyltransferase
VANLHQTVLLHEAVDALVQNESGCYIDGTFGRGGHSAEILSRLGAQGRLVAVDKDLQAIEQARQFKEGDTRFDFEHGSFARLPHQLRGMGIDAVDGILLDLGVSSPQLDDGQRGFSFSNDGPLDMRMDTSSGMTAAQWLAQASHGEIARVLREYGEERYAGRIANGILRALAQGPLETTAQLAKVVSESNPRWEKHKHPATRAFQAIRIHINNELADLEECLACSVELLRAEGRLVVISFHSLEDRLVKRFIRRMARGDELPANVPVTEQQLNRRLRPVGKAQRASPEEVAANPRARSAVMRVAEKINTK